MDTNPHVLPRHFLTFFLGQELFAVAVSSVRQVLALPTLIKVSEAPDYVLGVTRLMGNRVPVLDMRLRLGIGRTEQTADTCVVIVESGSQNERGVFGVLVDSVREVVELSPEVMLTPPELVTGVGARLMRGLARHSNQLVMIVAFDGMLTEEIRRSVVASQIAPMSW